MKNIKFLVSALVLLGAIGGAGYFLSSEKNVGKNLENEIKKNDLQQTQTSVTKKETTLDLFPKTIENYALYKSGFDATNSQCKELVKKKDATNYKKVGVFESPSGLTGKFCQNTFNAEYRNQNDNKLVSIALVKITEGEDLYKKTIEEGTKLEIINNYEVLRNNARRILWTHKQGSLFDYILSTEATWEKNEQGYDSYFYKEIATGENPVTQYFLKTYPPVSQ
jgi:hypothetical protein